MNFKNHFEFQKNQTNSTSKFKIIKQNSIQQVNCQDNNMKKNIQHQRNLTPNLVQNLNNQNYPQYNILKDQNIQGQNQSTFVQNYKYDIYQQQSSFQQENNYQKNQKIKIIEIKNLDCSSKMAIPERSVSHAPQTRPSINRQNTSNLPQEEKKFPPNIEYKSQIQCQNQQYPIQQQFLKEQNQKKQQLYSNNNLETYTGQINETLIQYPLQNETTYKYSKNQDLQNVNFENNKFAYYRNQQNCNQQEVQMNNQFQNDYLFDEKYNNQIISRDFNRFQPNYFQSSDHQLNYEQISNSEFNQLNNHYHPKIQSCLQNFQVSQIEASSNSSKNKITIVKHEPSKEQQSFEQNNQIDMYESLCRSIVFRCERCQMAIESNSAQLACYHSYHQECLEEHIISQIKSKKQFITCQCGVKISEPTIKYQLNLSNSSSLIQEFHKNQLFSLLEKNQQFYNFKVCHICNFFWIQNRLLKTSCCPHH